jgi:(E)-4-hydroxy-3-methylbut-2-enyl-diphosphate synthase
MTNTDTRDTDATLRQIRALHKLGCELIRLAVPDMESAYSLAKIKENSPIPLIADIHFDYRLALQAIQSGVSAIRLNPGNISDTNGLKLVADAAIKHNIPIRVGANSGSVRPALVQKCIANGMNHDDAIAEALVESALEQCQILENFGVTEIKAALKSSSVPITVAAYRKFADRTDYPLHVGITEAGTPKRGIVKSAVGIGTLLMEGIGNTIRVSLTGDPAEEVVTAQRILEACGMRHAQPEIISCPTCGRTEIDLIGLANRVEQFLESINESGQVVNLRKIAVMGCAVNGPGEARDADLGMAGGKNGKLVIFKLGEVLGAFDTEPGFELFKAEILKQTTSKN